ncbi:MAG: DUF4114 domain-containing protein [Cyanobacteria bacterium J06581_3]
MKKLLFSACLAAAASLSFVTAATAQNTNQTATIQDADNLKSSDAALFNQFNDSVNTERLAMDEYTLPELFADSLKWDGLSESIDVVFINEGAGYRNQLLFSLNDGPQTMLFDDIASTESILKETQSKLDRKANKIAQVESDIAQLETTIQTTELSVEERAAAESDLSKKQKELTNRTNALALEKTLGDNGLGSMKLGDSKSLSGLSGDVGIDFFIKADGARRDAGKIYGADPDANADGLQHLIAREFKQGNDNWVLLGFEDLYGVHTSEGGSSDRDFNDVVIAVRGVTGRRVDEPQDVPEPMTIAGLLLVGGLGLGQARRKAR